MDQAQLERQYINHAVQDAAELAEFIKLVRAENVRSYLEIGSKYGGSLWSVVRAMPKGSRAVAVDLPYGSTFKRPVSQPYLEQTVQELRKAGYDMSLIIGDSTDEAVIAEVRERAPYDLLLIDANHVENYVRSDWKNYGPMAKIVAFHDIAFDMKKNTPGKIFPIEVPKVWAEIKRDYRHREIKLCHTKRDNGFGILWQNS